jgi:glutamate racemase
VGFVERGEVKGPEIEGEVLRYIRPLQKRTVDSLVLGCTHYPLIREVIGKVMGDEVRLISSDEEIAREVEENLVRRGYLRDASRPPEHRFMCTGSVEQAVNLGRMFLGPEVEKVDRIDLPLQGARP